MRVRTLLAIVLIVGLIPGLDAIATARDPLAPTGGPPLHLITPDDEVMVHRQEGKGARANIALFLSSPDGAFELRSSMADYDSPVTLEQWIDGGTTQVALDPTMLRDWGTLKDMIHLRMTDADDDVLEEHTVDVCFNSEERERVHDDGPLVPSYPMYCWYLPFMLGNVAGIDEGWAMKVQTWGMFNVRNLPDGTYTIEAEIDPTYVDLFSVPPEADSVTIDVTVMTVEGDGGHHSPAAGPGTQRPSVRTPAPLLPETTTPDPDTVPDLISLPAWSVRLRTNTRKGKVREQVAFAANVWNRGPAPLVVEGFRQQGEPLMDAYQYFTDAGGTQVARADVGNLEYDDRDGHEHWHLQLFAQYDLLDESQTFIVRSGKEAFCLFPTDAVDLGAPRADWEAGFWGGDGLDTACGGPNAIWIREVLEAGWGDTYYQSRPGQSFSVTGLPNGTYYIRVTANPDGMLYEADETNNESLREIQIKGRPGNRRVVVPPWHGIDSDHAGDGCAFNCAA